MAAQSQVSTAPVVFNFNSHEVRTILHDGEPWFVAMDVCSALGYRNVSQTVGDHLDDDEKGVSTGYTPGGQQALTIISESGLYALVLRSRKPEARKFANWVTSEVLPAIRKTGSYAPAELQQHMLRCIQLAAAATEQFKEAIFTDLVGNHESEICHRRFMVCFTHDMKPQAQQVEMGAYIASADGFAKIISAPDTMFTNKELANLAKACNDRLAKRIGH